MKLIVWNSQGDKWDDLMQHYLSPLIAAPQTDAVLGFLVESGWAPWIRTQDVVINAIYSLPTDKKYFDAIKAAKSTFCQNVQGTRSQGRSAFWIPWRKNLDSIKNNSRCSLGGVRLPVPGILLYAGTERIAEGFKRPVIRTMVLNGAEEIYVFLVHFISASVPAWDEMTKLTTIVRKMTPIGRPAIIVGDMNVDLLKYKLKIPGWQILNTGVATQQSGGELDYALLSDPSNALVSATPSVVEKFKTGNNSSDHSVMQYDLVFNK